MLVLFYFHKSCVAICGSCDSTSRIMRRLLFCPLFSFRNDCAARTPLGVATKTSYTAVARLPPGIGNCARLNLATACPRE
jgi:hypothetical protein